MIPSPEPRPQRRDLAGGDSSASFPHNGNDFDGEGEPQVGLFHLSVLILRVRVLFFESNSVHLCFSY
jgi:hypothetical protein